MHIIVSANGMMLWKNIQKLARKEKDRNLTWMLLLKRWFKSIPIAPKGKILHK
jgi:hypothetical protein